MPKKSGFGKLINTTLDENREKFFKQMVRDLPANHKQDLGHVIFRLAGKSKVLIYTNPVIADPLASLLRSLQDENGMVTISKPMLIGNFGVIGGSDLILSVGNEVGTFDISDTLLCQLAFDNCFILLACADTSKRFFKNGQWVIPIKVIDCCSNVQQSLVFMEKYDINVVFSEG